MIQIFLSGILLGLTLAVMIGPAFFSLLQTSVKRGFRAGFFLAIGIFVSDLTLVMLSYFGISQLVSEPGNQLLFGLIGGGILIGYGAFTFRRRPAYSNVEEGDVIHEKQKPGVVTYLVKGFFLNLANPFLLIFWMGSMGVLTSQYGPRSYEILIFFSGTLFTVLLTDLVKCYIANQIKRYLRPRILSFVNHALGILLIIFGILLIFKVITEL